MNFSRDFRGVKEEKDDSRIKSEEKSDLSYRCFRSRAGSGGKMPPPFDFAQGRLAAWEAVLAGPS